MPSQSSRIRVSLAAVVVVLSAVPPCAMAQVDPAINEHVWKQRYGVLDAQMAEQAPYAGWLSQDADGDGVENGAEFIAGTNPFHKLPTDPHFRAPKVLDTPANLTLTFPTVPGKIYSAESSETLIDAWNRGSLPSTIGDGSEKSLNVPKSSGQFFRISVSDQATQGDQVSDWAKFVLGLSPSQSIESQTSFNHNSLAAELETQNVITLSALDLDATQPPDAQTAASDYGVIQITRSGFMLLGEVEIPLVKSGSAIEGIDFAPVPSSIVFPPGVNSIDVRIIPLNNPTRTGTATVFLTAEAPGSAESPGHYSLGAPASAGITIYPAAVASGTGLTGSFYPGSHSTYSNALNFSDLSPGTYSYTRTNSTTGTAVISYFGNPATPYTVGSSVPLQFTSGNLGSTYNKTYIITELPSAASFKVNITGTSLPNSGTGNSNIGSFSPPIVRNAPVLDYTWGHGSPNANNYINSDNYSVVWEGWLAPTVAGNYVFRLDANDKARVSIDTGSGLQQILENGWDTAATNTYKSSAPIALSIPASPAARYRMKVEFVELTGTAKCKFHWQINGGSFVVIPSANVFTNNSGSTAGWTGTYYNNPDFIAPAARVQTDTDLTAGNSGDWLTGSVDPLVHHNNYSARWTGQILPQYSQKYYFIGKANEGFKLWINQQLILDHWTGSSGTERTASIDLVANVFYDIQFESYDTTGSSEAHLWWYSDDQAKQIVPTQRLFPGNSGKPAITSPTEVVTIIGSGSPFVFNVTSSNGGTVTASGLPPWLTLVNGVLSGTPSAAGIHQFTLTTTNAAGSSSAVMTLEVQETPGQLTRDLWTSGVTGPSIADVPWSAAPSSSDVVSSAQDNTTTYGNNTGERLRGYFIAPVTGNYYFWIAASNVAELWISNDKEPVNKVLRAKVNSPGTSPATWNAQAGQKSQWLSLVAGRKYYLEILHNSGSSAGSNHLSAAWFVDPTGNTANPIANGCPPATAATGGILPGHVLLPWDNPPTTTVPGAIYVTNLQGVSGLSGITATGGAFLRVNGNTAVLQLHHSGLTSGIVSRRILDSSDNVLFDANSQDKNYPALKTSDGGYTWEMQPAHLTALNNGQVRIEIATVNHPTGEVSGTFGRTAGSQTPPAVPSSPGMDRSPRLKRCRELPFPHPSDLRPKSLRHGICQAQRLPPVAGKPVYPASHQERSTHPGKPQQ